MPFYALLAQAAKEVAGEGFFEKWLRYLTEHGAWDLISLAITLAGVIGVSLWLFVPRRRVPGLNVYITSERTSDERFPLRLRIEIRNFSGSPVLIRRAGFIFAALRPHPQCHMHTATQECEVKFPGRVQNELCEPDSYLRQGGCVMTWLAIDPAHTDEEVKAAYDSRRLGILHCSIVHVGDKAQLYDLRTKC